MRKNAADIPLHLWESFIAVIEEGTFQKAAEKLTTSQPTITRHIHQLEESLPLTLFELRGRTKEPTPFAFKLYRQVRSRFASLNADVESSIKAFNYNENVHLKIACPQELTGLITQHIKFKGGVSFFDIAQVDNSEWDQFDLILSRNSLTLSSLKSFKLKTDTFVSLIPHKLVKTGFKKRDLQQQPFCLCRGDTELLPIAENLNVVYMTSWWDSAELMAHQGLAWTIIPKAYAKKGRNYQIFQNPYKISSHYYVHYNKSSEEHQWAKNILPQLHKLV